VINGGFDIGLDGWGPIAGDPYGGAWWSPLDSCTTPPCSPSGSLTQQFPGSTQIARQRFTVTPGKKFSFHAAVRSLFGRVVGIDEPAHIEFWTDRLPDGRCTGTQLIPDVRLFGGRTLRAGVWESDAAYGFIPATATCAAISLDNYNFADQLWFDAVYFGFEQ
jgi:hypothetical protein